MDYQLGTAEERFAALIWAHEPISSTDLAKLCAGAFGWKKSTSYTVLSRLCGKGLFQNQNGIVTSLVSADDFHAEESREFVDNSFGGSLPAFLAAFMNGRRLSEQEADELQEMIRKYREEA